MFTMFALIRAKCGWTFEQCGLAMPADMHAAKQSDSYYASDMFLRDEVDP